MMGAAIRGTRLRLFVIAALSLFALLCASAPALASDRSIAAKVTDFANTLAADASSVGEALDSRDAELVIRSAKTMRSHLVSFKKALAGEEHSTSKGATLKKLGVKAANLYIKTAGAWVQMGQALKRDDAKAAKKAAKRSESYATKAQTIMDRISGLLYEL